MRIVNWLSTARHTSCTSIISTHDVTNFSRFKRKIHVIFNEPVRWLRESILGLGAPLPDIVMGGDFNLPKVSWESGYSSAPPSCPKVIRDMADELNTFCNEFYLKQTVSKPTHKDGNILDLVFTNNMNLISNININETLLSISHHKFIEVSTPYKTKLLQDDTRKPDLQGFNALNF